MKKRRFDDELSVSEIGLGTWQLGADWGEVSDSEAQSILDSALENGVNLFDTADVYGLGLSERRIREFKERNQANKDVAIITKLGRFPEPGWPENFSHDNLSRHVEASLERLGMEALDLTQLHCIPTELLVENEVFESLRKIRDAGKIRRFGASVESMEEAEFCLEQEGLSSLQIIFNIYRQKPIDSLFQRAKEKDVALIIRLPLASGLLSGNFTTATTFPENDHRNYNRDGQCFNVGETFAGIPFEKAVELTDRLGEILPKGTSLSQLALRWILDFNEVTTVIPGATKTGQVISNCAASDLEPLSPDLHNRLREFYTSEVQEHIRGVY